ncbi:MAG: putative nucleotidyltransferase substrate binding domain-containing protein [Candidatus Altiarchaeota archaeon]
MGAVEKYGVSPSGAIEDVGRPPTLGGLLGDQGKYLWYFRKAIDGKKSVAFINKLGSALGDIESSTADVQPLINLLMRGHDVGKDCIPPDTELTRTLALSRKSVYVPDETQRQEHANPDGATELSGGYAKAAKRVASGLKKVREYSERIVARYSTTPELLSDSLKKRVGEVWSSDEFTAEDVSKTIYELSERLGIDEKKLRRFVRGIASSWRNSERPEGFSLFSRSQAEKEHGTRRVQLAYERTLLDLMSGDDVLANAVKLTILEDKRAPSFVDVDDAQRRVHRAMLSAMAQEVVDFNKTLLGLSHKIVEGALSDYSKVSDAESEVLPETKLYSSSFYDEGSSRLRNHYGSGEPLLTHQLSDGMRQYFTLEFRKRYVDPKVERERQKIEKYPDIYTNPEQQLKTERENTETHMELSAQKQFDKIYGLTKDVDFALQDVFFLEEQVAALTKLTSSTHDVSALIDKKRAEAEKRLQEARSRVEERARFAVESITKDMRIEKYAVFRDTYTAHRMVSQKALEIVDEHVRSNLEDKLLESGDTASSAAYSLRTLRSFKSIIPLTLAAVALSDGRSRAAAVGALYDLVTDPASQSEMDALKRLKVVGLGRILDVLAEYSKEYDPYTSEDTRSHVSNMLTEYSEDLLCHLLENDSIKIRKMAVEGLSPNIGIFGVQSGSSYTQASELLAKALNEERNRDIRADITSTLWSRAVNLSEASSADVLAENMRNEDQSIAHAVALSLYWVYDDERSRKVIRDMGEKDPGLVDVYASLYDLGASYVGYYSDKAVESKNAAVKFLSIVDDPRARRKLEEIVLTADEGDDYHRKEEKKKIAESLLKSIHESTTSPVLYTILSGSGFYKLNHAVMEPTVMRGFSKPLTSFDEHPEDRQTILTDILDAAFKDRKTSERISSALSALEGVNPLAAQFYAHELLRDDYNTEAPQRVEVLKRPEFISNYVELSRVSFPAARTLMELCIEQPDRDPAEITYSLRSSKILKEYTRFEVTPKTPTPEVSTFSQVFSIGQRDYVPLAVKLFATPDGIGILGQERVREILGEDLSARLKAAMEVDVTPDEILLTENIFGIAAVDEDYYKLSMRHHPQSKSDPMRAHQEVIEEISRKRGLCGLMHGTTVESRDSIANGLGGRMMHKKASAGIYSTIDMKTAKIYANGGLYNWLPGQEMEGTKGGLILMLGGDLRDSYICLEPGFGVTEYRFVDSGGTLLRAPSRVTQALDTIITDDSSSEEWENLRREIAVRIKQRNIVRPLEEELLGKLSAALSSEPGVADSISRIYGGMREHHFPEAKIIEVVDSYIKLVLTSDKTNPEDQNHRLRRIMEQAIQHNGLSISKVHDSLVAYPEISMELDPGRPFTDNMEAIERHILKACMAPMEEADDGTLIGLAFSLGKDSAPEAIVDSLKGLGCEINGDMRGNKYDAPPQGTKVWTIRTTEEDWSLTYKNGSLKVQKGSDVVMDLKAKPDREDPEKINVFTRAVIAASVSEKYPEVELLDLANVLTGEMTHEGPDVEERIFASTKVVYSQISDKRAEHFRKAITESVHELSSGDLEMPPEETYDFALTASSSRGEATPFSDYDAFFLIRSRDVERQYAPFFDAIETRVFKKLTEYGYAIDAGAMQRVGWRITFEDLDSKVLSDAALMGQDVNPTTMMDLQSMLGRTLSAEMKEHALTKYGHESEALRSSLQTQINGFARFFREGASQALSGDAPQDIKTAFTRIIPFMLYYMMAGHMGEIKDHLSKGGKSLADIPNSTLERLQMLSEAGIIGDSDAKNISTAYLGIQRARFKTSVMEQSTHGAEVDPMLFTIRERENFEGYLKTISDFIDKMGMKDTPVILAT